MDVLIKYLDNEINVSASKCRTNFCAYKCCVEMRICLTKNFKLIILLSVYTDAVDLHCNFLVFPF